MTEQSIERPKRMWRSVLAATAIASLGAGVFAALSGDEITDPAKFRENGPDWASAQEAGFAFAVPAVAALAVWAVFLVLIFRRHRWWKSIVALLVIILVATLVAVPARIVTFTGHVSADDQALAEWRESARGRVRALRAPLFAEDGSVLLTRGLPTPENSSDVDRFLVELRDSRARFETYRTAINAELRASRQALVDLDVFEGSKIEPLAWYDAILAPESNTQKHLAATARLMDLQEQAYTFLDSHRNTWTIQDGHFGFYSHASVEEFQETLEQLYEADAQIDFLNGAMGSEWGARE
jgi:hypothetical protein